MILLVDEGRLESLELAWYERPIGTFAPATDLEVLANPFLPGSLPRPPSLPGSP